MTEETVLAEISIKSLEQATLRERIVAAILSIAALSPPEEVVVMMQDKAGGAVRNAEGRPMVRGMVHDAAQLGYSSAVMLFKKHLMDALDETKPLAQDLTAILRNCTVVTTAHHGQKTTSINVVGDTDTVLSLREIITALSGGIEAPMGCWRGRRIVELLEANNAEVKRRRELKAGIAELHQGASQLLQALLDLGGKDVPEDLRKRAETLISGSVRTENADDHELAPGARPVRAVSEPDPPS